MKLVAASIFTKDGVIYAEDLQFVSTPSRNCVRELMHELVRVAVANTHNIRKIFEHPPWQIVVLNLNEQILVLVTDTEYPASVSYELLMKLHQHPERLQNIIQECQDPSRSMYQPHETLVIVHENFQSMEDIDELVQKSERLSDQTKIFYRTTHNRCCSIS